MDQRQTGIVLRGNSGFYYVETDDGIFESKARGNVVKSELDPVPGDFAEIIPTGQNTALLNAILPRKNYLVRPAVANVDNLFLVVSTRQPVPNLPILDKITAIAEFYGIEPYFIFTKSDIADSESLLKIYEKAGFRCFLVHPGYTDDLSHLRDVLAGKVSVFTGNTGCGKSTVLNRLFPELSLQTAQISKKLGRGKHTTRHVEFFKLCGGYVADTPGFSTVDLTRYGILEKEKLASCFRDFLPHLDNCTFTGCAHIAEKGCGVRFALDEGEIHPSRYASYIRAYSELKDLKQWERAVPGVTRSSKPHR